MEGEEEEVSKWTLWTRLLLLLAFGKLLDAVPLRCGREAASTTYPESQHFTRRLLKRSRGEG